jgi:hypothetical protein
MALWDTWIDTVLRSSYLPAVQGGWNHQELLDTAWEQVVSVMMPMLITSSPRFRRENHDITLVAEQSTYTIPEHAMLRKLHLAHLIDTDGRPGKLHRREPTEDEFFFESTSGHPISIRLHDTYIELNPAPSAADILVWPTLRTWIHRRPGRFVRATDDGSGDNPARAAQVLTSSSGTVTYTTTMPSSFAADSEHDFYSQTEPHRRLGTAVAATGAPSTSSQTFSTANAALVSAGDYVCLKNETCFMPVPVDMGRHIKDLVIFSIGKTQSDKDAYQTALESLQRDVSGMFRAAADPLPGNPLTQTLFHSPFLRAIGTGRGRRMVRE